MADDSDKREQRPLPFAEAQGSYDEEQNLLVLALQRVHADLYLAQFMFWLFNATEAGAKGPLKKSYEQLGARPRGLCCSPGKARATVREARRLKLVRVVETTTADGGQSANAYVYDRALIRAVLRLRPSVTSEQGAVSDEQGAVSDEQGAVSDEQGAVSDEQALIGIPPSCSSTLLFTAASRDGACHQDQGAAGGSLVLVRTAGRKKTHGLVLASCVPPDQVLAWTGVERRLLSLGVYADLAGELLAGAAQRGATPEDVSALADHFESKPGAWTAGALTIAVKRWSAGTSTSPAQAYDAAALWPPPSDAYQKSRAREAAGRLRDATASEERNRQARLNQERQAALARESRLGPQLDALGEDELAALIAATPRAQLEVFSKARKERPLKGQLRDVLLVALSQQQQPQTQENFQ